MNLRSTTTLYALSRAKAAQFRESPEVPAKAKGKAKAKKAAAKKAAAKKAAKK